MQVILKWILSFVIDTLISKAIIPAFIWTVQKVIDIATLEIIRKRNQGKGSEYAKAPDKDSARTGFNNLP